MPLDNCLCRDRRQPATASYLDLTLASLFVRKGRQVLLRSHDLRRQGDHSPNVSFSPTQSNMDALQADASAIPDDSVDHVASALVNMQVTAPAAATVPASTPVDTADKSAAAALPAAAIVPASTLVDLADIDSPSPRSPRVAQ
jgi:hypothetical protein